MEKIVVGVVGVVVLGIALVAAAIQAGLPNFAADSPHSAAVLNIIEWARERSIARRAADVVPPGDLSSVERRRRGAGNYDAMCAGCHLSPGTDNSEIRKGLYPMPPKLAMRSGEPDSRSADARRFWIIKHGIKGSGMSAWSKGGMGDESIWDLVAFLKILPDLSLADYRQQVAVSGGHAHEGMTEHAVHQPALHPSENSGQGSHAKSADHDHRH